MRAATTHSAGTTLFTFTALKWTITAALPGYDTGGCAKCPRARSSLMQGFGQPIGRAAARGARRARAASSLASLGAPPPSALALLAPQQGISVSNVDMNDLDAVKRAIDSGPTTMVMLESPTNPRLQITDIRRISEMAHAKGALVCVDNSMMAPVFAAPLELGADISMTSATKFISGQSDITGGTLAVKGEQLGKDIYFHQNAEGLHLGPFDCWLALRGIKTMALRMERQQENAMKMAKWLEAHPAVTYATLSRRGQHEPRCGRRRPQRNRGRGRGRGG